MKTFIYAKLQDGNIAKFEVDMQNTDDYQLFLEDAKQAVIAETKQAPLFVLMRIK